MLFIHIQVFKGIKNGVQEVAVKVLINSDEIQVQMFQEVSLSLLSIWLCVSCCDACPCHAAKDS